MRKELIGGVAHVCVSADGNDAFDRAVAFYTQVLGFEVSRQWRNRAGNKRVMLDAGNGSIELNADGTSTATGVLHHYCLESEDVDAAIAYVREKGYKVVVDPMTVGGNETPPHSIREAMFEGPCGELIQLQHMDF